MKQKSTRFDIAPRVAAAGIQKVATPPVLLCIAVFLLTACPGSGNTPRQMFEAVVLRPVPAGITLLEGTGDTMGGYNLFLRFRADSSAMTNVLSRYHYKKTDCRTIRFPMSLPPGYDRFTGGWKPTQIDNPACYEAEGAASEWSQSGHHKLLIDSIEGTVYFHGIGI